MASLPVPKQGFSPENDADCGSGVGHRRNQPMNLTMAPPSPQLMSLNSLFVVSPGLSPDLLNSLGFLSLLQTNPLPLKPESAEVSQSDGKYSNASGDKSANDGYN